MPQTFKTDVALKESGAYEEGKLHDKYRYRWIIGASIPAAILLPLLVPFYALFAVWGDGYGNKLPWDTKITFVKTYFSDLLNVILGSINSAAFIQQYIIYWFKVPVQAYIPFYALITTWAVFPFIIAVIGMKGNPYRKTPNVYGDARYATEEDINSMAKRNLIGFSSDTGPQPFRLFLVGRFRDKKNKPKLLKMGETLSILLLAPPGTGKSIGFIVPSTVTLDRCSLFLHDQKPELFDMTSGHRATIGPVFQLKWSAQDLPNGDYLNQSQRNLISPELIERDEEGNEILDEENRVKTKPIFYPCWNPLSPKSMPAPGDRRDLYIERLVNVLCPDTKSGDKFWTSKARAGLIGMIQYLVSKVDFATHPLIKGSWEGIPESWQGKEASFPMLIDWLAYAQLKYDDGSDDPMRQMFKACVEDARRMDDIFDKKIGMRVLNRAINELTSLMNTPDRTRGSIIQTADEALSPFKNAAVRQRTATSDFAFYELRGMPIPEAKAREQAKVLSAQQQGKVYKPRYKEDEFRPVTIYISIPLEDAKTFATLTGIFVDSANAYLVANGPNAIDDQGNQNGPMDFGFLLDEAPQLPKLDTITNGPAVGRSKRVFYVIVGQDFGQFMEKYSKEEVETLKSTTAIKIILTQNNENTAQQISKIVGKMTIVKHSYSPKSSGGSQTKGVGGAIEDVIKDIGSKKMQASESLEGVDFIRPEQIMAMPEGRHLVIVQNYANRPLMLETPKFFEEPEIISKVYNLRKFSGPAPTLPMPKDLMVMAKERWESTRLQEAEHADLRAKIEDPRVIIVLSPEDMASMRHTEPSFSQEWSFCPVQIPPEASFVEDPMDGSTLTLTDPTEASQIIDGGRVLVFDKDTLNRLNEWLDSADQPKISEELAIFLNSSAVGVGEMEADNLYELGYQGSVRLDLTENPENVEPHKAARWVVDIMTYILNVEEQRRLFDV